MSRNTNPSLPHSWSLKNWPDKVYPGDSSKGTYITRAYRDELLQAGALSRVGREIVVIGERYSRWLEKNAANVPGYVCPANRNDEQQTEAASCSVLSHPPTAPVRS